MISESLEKPIKTAENIRDKIESAVFSGTKPKTEEILTEVGISRNKDIEKIIVPYFCSEIKRYIKEIDYYPLKEDIRSLDINYNITRDMVSYNIAKALEKN